MSLINLNNAHSIEVESRSIQLHSESHGGYYLEMRSLENLERTLLYVADGRAQVMTLREAVHSLRSMLVNSRSLYSLQRMLNDPMWKELRLTVEVEAVVTHTEVGFPGDYRMSLLVKTTWQDNEPSIDEI